MTIKSDKKTQTLGEILAQHRHALNLEIEFIAKALKVKDKDINAIEKNELDKLSSNLYISGIITQYAKIVGVDRDIVKLKYKELTSNSKKKTTSHRLRIDDDVNHSPEREIFVGSFVFSVIIIFILLFYYNYTIKTSNTQFYKSIEIIDHQE